MDDTSNFRQLCVFGIHPNTSARDIGYEFEKYGRLKKVNIPSTRKRKAIYAFVEFVTGRDANDAYENLKEIRGRKVKIEWAKHQTPLDNPSIQKDSIKSNKDKKSPVMIKKDMEAGELLNEGEFLKEENKCQV
jgi:RNA recognition motif-containing protein